MPSRIELLGHSFWILLAAGIVLLAMFVSQTPASSRQAPTEPEPTSGAEPAAPTTAEDDISGAFPDKWFGTWSGPFEIRMAGRPTTILPMSLRIEPIAESDRFTWEIIYGEGNAAQVRPYELVPVDAAQGRYQIDEKNSIILSAALFGRDLTSIFTVQGSLIVVRMRFEDDAIHYHITAGNESAKTETGAGQPGVPPVFDIPAASVQSAVLKRAAAPISTPKEGAEEH
jgi:hypothetical protein